MWPGGGGEGSLEAHERAGEANEAEPQPAGHVSGPRRPSSEPISLALGRFRVVSALKTLLSALFGALKRIGEGAEDEGARGELQEAGQKTIQKLYSEGEQKQ